MEVVIDKEFEALGGALAPEELSILEFDIAKHGCLDALKVWRQTGILLDGHTRRKSCRAHGIEYRVHELGFDNREDAYNWAINWQLGRRNITEQRKSYLRGKRYQAEKKTQGGTGANQHEQSGSDCHSAKTAEKIAKEYGVSEKTIRTDAEFAAAVDAIAEKKGEPAKAEILSGKSELSKKDVIASAPKSPAKKPKRVKPKASRGLEDLSIDASRIAEQIDLLMEAMKEVQKTESDSAFDFKDATQKLRLAKKIVTDIRKLL